MALDGGGLSFTDSFTGPGDDRPVLVLHHPFFFDKSVWDSLAAKLVWEWRVIAFDAPGHGEDSGDPGRGYPVFVSETLEVLDELEVDRFIVGGISQGGIIAQETLLAAPTRVAGVIEMSTTAGCADAAEVASMDELAQVWGDGLVAPGVTRGLAGYMTNGHPMADALGDEWARVHSGVRIGPALATLAGRRDLTGLLGGRRAATLVVHGEDDQTYPVQQRLLEVMEMPADRRSHHVHPGGSHLVALTEGEEIVPIVAAWLGVYGRRALGY